MAMLLIQLLLGLAIVLLSIRYYLRRNFEYWNKRKVPGPKPVTFFGTMKDVQLGRIHLSDHMKSVYDSYSNVPVVGTFFNTVPTLLVRDPDIIKDVLIKSFTSFPQRGLKINEEIQPLSQHLFVLDYERWKPLRKNLSPTFTSGKLKEMFYLINECADNFIDYLQILAKKEEPIECRELTAKFTTDVIGMCAFGLNMNAVADENSEFRKVGRNFLANTLYNRLKLFAQSLPKWLGNMLKPIFRDEKATAFFVNIVKATMDHRKKNNIRRHDFIDHLMDIRDNHEQLGVEEMTDVLLAAQAFVFFVAGFETSSSTMSHAMYELAQNPKIQDQLREEVNAAFKDNEGKLSYDALKKMRYLDKVFQETLRKYPPVGFLIREATSDHTFTTINLSITKGSLVMIPVYAIQHDPNIYPDPEKFDPERFDDEVVKSRPIMSYLPFGDGPRICIGERFAHNQSKLGLATIIRHFKLEVCEKTIKRYEKIPGLPLSAPKGGLWLKIKKL